MKKRICSILLSGLMLASMISGGACAPTAGSNDPNVLNVKIYEGGHGTEYIRLVADKFNELYEGQYSVELLQPSTQLVGNTVYREIHSGSNADVMTGSTLDATDGLGRAGFGECFADITESVLNQPAIKFDGTLEDRTILEKLGDVKSDYIEKQSNGKWYLIPYVNGIGGMAVNTKVLSTYQLEIPRTTNELFAAADYMMEQAGGSTSKPKPFTYAATGNNYAFVAILSWLAQLGGEAEYRKFMTYTDGGREMDLQECANLFKDNETLSTVMELFVQLYDYNLQTTNVRSQTFEQAQNQFMRGRCAFYFVGDWMFNEEYVRNANYLNDITLVQVPVASALGVKTFGANTKYQFSDELCDQILCEIIDGVDANLDSATIESNVEEALSVQLDTEDVQKIIAARGCTQDRSGAGVFINANSPKKELAARFLRFFASTECGEMVAQNIHCASPYAPGSLANSEYKWIQSSAKMIANRHNTPLGSQLSGHRKDIGSLSLFPAMGEIPVVALTDEDHVVSIYDDATYEKVGTTKIYKDKAAYFMNLNYEDALNCIRIGKWSIK